MTPNVLNEERLMRLHAKEKQIMLKIEVLSDCLANYQVELGQVLFDIEATGAVIDNET